MHTKPLFVYLQSQSHKNCRLSKFCMVCELRQLVEKCFTDGVSHVAPDTILRNLKAIASHMKWGRQEDAHEFLRYVIESINKSFPNLKSQNGSEKKLSIAERIFQGELESQIKCLHCQHTSTKCDPFLDVCLDVKNVPSIEVGLQRFTAPETLQGGNAYMCSNCKKMVKARKMFRLGKLPQVFTVQLKRYSFYGGKVSNHVSFPEVLNLAPYMSKPSTGKISMEYDLYAVLIHEGRSTNSGHYYCHVRGPNSKWFCMNDSHVSPINVQQVLKSQAYLLFYLQKTKQMEGLGRQVEGQIHQNGHIVIQPELDEDKTLHQKLRPSISLNSLTPKKEETSLDRSLQLHPSGSKQNGQLNGSLDHSPTSSKTSLVGTTTESKHHISEQMPKTSEVPPNLPHHEEKSPLSPKVREKVTEVWFTSKWKVEAMQDDDDDDRHPICNGTFKSTSAWKVEHLDNKDAFDAVPISNMNGLKNGFSCPTFDWDAKKGVIAEMKEDKDVEEELLKKKLTFGRQILTWGGQQSMMDANDEASKANRKRKWDELNEEIDRGKTKKFKKKHSKNIGNAFQHHADGCYSNNFRNDQCNASTSKRFS